MKAGNKITLSGYLRSEHSGLSGEKVRIYFKASGGSEFTYVASSWTDSQGYYSKKVTADEDGTWKAVFFGAGTKGSASRTVHVNTK